MTFKNPPARWTLKFAITALMPAVLLAFTSCSSTPATGKVNGQANPAANANTPDFGGEIVTDAASTTATVVSVDHANRLVVLKRADGSQVTYKAAPGASGFDVVKAGDEVKVSVAEELAVFLGKNSVPGSAGANSVKLRVRLPGGTQAVATEVATLSFTAKITAINAWNDSVTLQLADGSVKTIHVSEAVNLADVNVGDNVSARVTEAAVLLLEKP
ncbi:MAG: hypothetical protein ABSF60_02445 [Verrucomicrobiota bacterium]